MPQRFPRVREKWDSSVVIIEICTISCTPPTLRLHLQVTCHYQAVIQSRALWIGLRGPVNSKIALKKCQSTAFPRVWHDFSCSDVPGIWWWVCIVCIFISQNSNICCIEKVNTFLALHSLDQYILWFLVTLLSLLSWCFRCPTYYRPQWSRGKVIFSQASVILFTGGCLPQCMLGYHTSWQQTPHGKADPSCQGDPHGKADPPTQCMLGDTGNKRAVCILLECNSCFIHKTKHINSLGIFYFQPRISI